MELAIKLLTQLIMSEGHSMLKDSHLAAIEAAKEQSTSLLKNFYKVCCQNLSILYYHRCYNESYILRSSFQSEDIFLDMFEDEYSEIQKRPLNVEWLMMDSNVLLPPTGTPMTGIEFTKRLPCGEVSARNTNQPVS